VTRLAYLDCVGGLAGDMLLAALLDAGADRALLEALPARLGLGPVRVEVRRVERQGVGALHVAFDGPEADEARSWRAIRTRLGGADLPERVRERALAVFERLARAEARVHAVDPDEVHFHELAAADTLLDVCGFVWLLEDLAVDEVVCSPLPLARGLVRAAHGVLPVPAPAVTELLRGAPAYGVDGTDELVTPTGAAIAATLAGGFGPLPELVLDRVGYGAGTRDTEQRPNLVRVLVGDRAGAAAAEVVLLETNLDDVNPEFLPDAAERCLAAGALDVWTAPVQMKKGRPGFVVAALARPADERRVATALFQETTALGVRVSRLRRFELEREHRVVDVGGTEVRVKIGRLDGRVVNVAPEHDDCAAAAAALGRPVKSVWAAALAAAERE